MLAVRPLRSSSSGSSVSPSLCCCLVAQWCLTLCDPMDGSPPGSSVHGSSQARIRSGVPSPGDLFDPGTKPKSPALQVDPLPLSWQGSPSLSLQQSVSLPRTLLRTGEMNHSQGPVVEWPFIKGGKACHQGARPGSGVVLSQLQTQFPTMRHWEHPRPHLSGPQLTHLSNRENGNHLCIFNLL